ncbi:MAG TPA: sulfotransferase [Rhodanobacteraceae bacterium]|jgi:tetratricopeptide (TPR) repeat protein
MTMAPTPEQQRLEQTRALMLRGDLVGAQRMLDLALAEHPESFELRRAQAGVHRKSLRGGAAEALLRKLLGERPHDAGCAFALAELLLEAVRPRAAGEALRTCFENDPHDANLAIRAIELLDEADRKADALAIADLAIAAAPGDARLHAYAGMLCLQLGEFERAREHCLFALTHDPRACEWHVPQGLASAQRYDNPDHPDFTLFNSCLQRPGLSDRARATLLFALGKAHDDIGDHAAAADHFRQANALAHAQTRWSRKDWRRAVEARLGSGPAVDHEPTIGHFVPLFIVGMPRSGTTLLAELLARHAGVCNRGELPWIATLAGQADLAGNPSAEALARGASFYALRARRDDAPDDVRWFIDKQPLNFRYLDLMLALFPDAKVIHCARDPRDTALSLWMQPFREDVQGYACDFGDIAIVMRDCDRLMTHWQRLFPHAIRTVRYEDLVTEGDSVLSALAGWIGLPEARKDSGDPSSIGTASLWQARQPVYSSSIQRWRTYAELVPELSRFPAG